MVFRAMRDISPRLPSKHFLSRQIVFTIGEYASRISLSALSSAGDFFPAFSARSRCEVQLQRQLIIPIAGMSHEGRPDSYPAFLSISCSYTAEASCRLTDSSAGTVLLASMINILTIPKSRSLGQCSSDLLDSIKAARCEWNCSAILPPKRAGPSRLSRSSSCLATITRVSTFGGADESKYLLSIVAGYWGEGFCGKVWATTELKRLKGPRKWVTLLIATRQSTLLLGSAYGQTIDGP